MAMATINKPTPWFIHHRSNDVSLSPSPFIISFPHSRTVSLIRIHARAPKTGSDGGRTGKMESFGSGLLRKPSVRPGKEVIEEEKEEESEDTQLFEEEEEEVKGWADLEDQILEDTVPLVGFVRMILHSSKYNSGDRLSPEHETTILQRLLPHHPQCETKIGCGIDYLTIGFHPDFEGSRCLFIVRKDGTLVDFSYWKCIEGLIRKNYPLYADSFIFKHFRQRRRAG